MQQYSDPSSCFKLKRDKETVYLRVDTESDCGDPSFMTIHVARDLKMVSLESLLPYENNARTHSKEQIEQLAASIKEFGFTAPILVDGNQGIIAGHGRFAAAKLLGLKEVPVIELAHLTPNQKRAYIIADNKLSLNAGWDLEMLQNEIAALGELEDIDLDVIGFSDEEMQSLLVDGELEEPHVASAVEQEEKKATTLNNVVETPLPSSAEVAQEHWVGMPEFKQEDKMPHRTLYVHFENDAAVASFAQLVRQTITEKTKYMWYPEAEKAVVADKVYATEP